MRIERKAPEIYKWFEYVYNEVKKREQKLQQSKISEGSWKFFIEVRDSVL